MGDCSSKPPIQQAHVVLCHEHHADNRTRIDDYKKTNTAYANLQLYCASAASKKPDEPAIFNHVGGRVKGGGRVGPLTHLHHAKGG